MKRLFSYLLAAVMLVSLLACGAGSAFADETAAVTIEASDIDLQLTLISTQLSKLVQNDSQNTWYYTVTDLDHDGNLEFIAATLHPQDRSTNLKVWEVGEDRKSLSECKLDKDEDESFPDIMTDAADTYHNVETDTWYYMFYDNLVISEDEVYTIKTAVNLKDGVIDYDAYAVEHVVLENTWRNISYTDANGLPISGDQYNAAGSNAFAGTERSSTNFEWLTAKDLEKATRIVDSYAVFAGTKKPTESFPVPRPAVLGGNTNQSAPGATPIPAPTAVPVPAPEVKFLSVTKNPTNESRKVGGTALFVACANAYESLNWTLVSPYGGEFSVQNFRNSFLGASVTGEYSTTLSIGNVSADMNGWGAYCTFYYKGQTQRTTTAYIYVQGEPAPQPETGSFDGSVYDIAENIIAIEVPGVDIFKVARSDCNIIGDVYVGAPATVYYNGRHARGVNVTGATINGSVTPESGSFDGYVCEVVRNSVTIEVPGVDYFTLDLSNCTVNGERYVGAPATVYYNGRHARGVYVTSATINGRTSPDVPEGGTFYGTVTDWNNSGVSVNLDGTTIVLISWDVCSVSGDIYIGAPATATWSGRTTKGLNFTYCAIEGRQPAPQPVYGSMSGTAHEGGGGFALNLADGTEAFVDAWICNVSGNFYDGASCTVYYTEPVSSSSIYQVDIYGSPNTDPAPSVDPAPEVVPETVYGQISGTAFRDNDSTAVIFLDNGDTVYVDIGICNQIGELVMAGGGNSCTVYYYNSPIAANIYSVDVFPAAEN